MFNNLYLNPYIAFMLFSLVLTPQSSFSADEDFWSKSLNPSQKKSETQENGDDLLNSTFKSTSSGSNQSGYPSRSNQSGYPSGSNQSGYPSRSNQSGYPSRSNQSGYPSRSNQSGYPSRSNQSGYPSRSNQSGYSSYSSQGGYPSRSDQKTDLSSSFVGSSNFSPNSQGDGLSSSLLSSNTPRSSQGGQTSSRKQNQDEDLLSSFIVHTPSQSGQSQEDSLSSSLLSSNTSRSSQGGSAFSSYPNQRSKPYNSSLGTPSRYGKGYGFSQSYQGNNAFTNGTEGEPSRSNQDKFSQSILGGQSFSSPLGDSLFQGFQGFNPIPSATEDRILKGFQNAQQQEVERKTREITYPTPNQSETEDLIKGFAGLGSNWGEVGNKQKTPQQVSPGTFYNTYAPNDTSKMASRSPGFGGGAPLTKEQEADQRINERLAARRMAAAQASNHSGNNTFYSSVPHAPVSNITEINRQKREEAAARRQVEEEARRRASQAATHKEKTAEEARKEADRRQLIEDEKKRKANEFVHLSLDQFKKDKIDQAKTMAATKSVPYFIDFDQMRDMIQSLENGFFNKGITCGSDLLLPGGGLEEGKKLLSKIYNQQGQDAFGGLILFSITTDDVTLGKSGGGVQLNYSLYKKDQAQFDTIPFIRKPDVSSTTNTFSSIYLSADDEIAYRKLLNLPMPTGNIYNRQFSNLTREEIKEAWNKKVKQLGNSAELKEAREKLSDKYKS